MELFRKALDKKIIESLSNNFGVENYDAHRFGEYKKEAKSTLTKKLKKLIKNILNYHPEYKQYLEKGRELVNPFIKEFENTWNNISNLDRDLLIDLLAYRVLGSKKVKLPRNNDGYWQAIETAKALADYNDAYDPNFMHFMLYKFNLNPAGYDIQFYFSQSRVAVDFLIEQYAYKIENEVIVEAEEGDVVLDIGGCWGDTALYFAHKVGNNGKVYSFEFIPDNLKLFKINTELNPNLLSNIELISNPVSNNSGDLIYFKDNGPGSKVLFEPFEGQTGTAKTVSIDDFVKNHAIDKLDFIKMDIEGAEPIALEGAIETIKKFRPKLAIAIYHSIHDLATISNWILDLNLDYEIFIGHYTIHAEETICFAKPKVR
ncbi:FkbM family methyltransferase [Lacinutrix sp. MEBiC02595]